MQISSVCPCGLVGARWNVNGDCNPDLNPFKCRKVYTNWASILFPIKAIQFEQKYSLRSAKVTVCDPMNLLKDKAFTPIYIYPLSSSLFRFVLLGSPFVNNILNNSLQPTMYTLIKQCYFQRNQTTLHRLLRLLSKQQPDRGNFDPPGSLSKS